MKALLRRLLRKLWPPRPAPAPPPAAMPPGLVAWRLGGGWTAERRLEVAGGQLLWALTLVCPTRRKSWPIDRRGWLTNLDRVAHPN